MAFNDHGKNRRRYDTGGVGWGNASHPTPRLTEIRLYTNALYTVLGYRETARRPNPHRPGWTVVDMAKPLPSVAAPGEG